MGFKPPRKQFRLRFEDPEYADLEIICGSLSIGRLLELTGMYTAYTAGQDDAAAVASLDRMFQILADALVSWNIEDDRGQPVPVTLDGIKTQDLDFILAIITAWMNAIAGVPAPLPAGSNGGGQFPEGSLPMEPLSPSLSS